MKNVSKTIVFFNSSLNLLKQRAYCNYYLLRLRMQDTITVFTVQWLENKECCITNNSKFKKNQIFKEFRRVLVKKEQLKLSCSDG